MKIIELRCENVKKLVAVTIRPDGNLVEITGRNGQGKTSVLDAIWWALEGQKNIQSVPIRKGAMSAKIKLDLGELKIARTFGHAKDKETGEPTGEFTTSIVVENAEGARFPSPQSVIDKLLGALSFDPLAFTRMKPGDQLETLKQFVPGVDFALIDSANDNDFRLRTELNRAAKDLRAREAAIVLPETEPESPVDEDALLGKLEAASRINTEIETRRLKRQTAASESERLMEQALERRKKIAKLENELQSLIAEADELETRATDQSNHLASLPELPPLVDIAGLRLSCAAARQNNEAFEKFKTAKEAKAKLAEQASGVEAQSIKLTKLIDQRKRQKADAIAAAKLPIDGVGFGDGAVLLNGIPFDQASDAEQLRASIAITAAMNPKLRVIRVRDGSLLDENAMKLLAEFADAHELQVWIERVDSSGKVGFVLEDGRLVSQPAGERAAT